MSRVQTVAQVVARFATTERIRVYGLMMAAPYLALAAMSLQSMTLGAGYRDYFGNVVGGDFLAFYTGAQFFLNDRLPEVYDFGIQRSFQNSVVDFDDPEKIHPFINPPFAVLLYSPFALLSYRVSLLLWVAGGAILLLLSVRLIRSELLNLRQFSVVAVSMGCFLFYPTVAWFRYAQTTPVTLLLYIGAFVLLRRRRDTWAGVCLGCLAFKPQLAIVLACVLLLKRRWRAVMGGAASVLGWIVAGFLISPSAMWAYWELGPELAAVLRSGGYPTWGINSCFGFSVLLLDGLSPAAADAACVVMTASCLGLLAWAWLRTPWEPGARRWDLAMAGSIAWGLMISPHLYIYDAMLLLLPFAIVWNHFPSRDELLEADNGYLLSWSLLVWAFGAYGTLLTMGQQKLTEGIGMPPTAIQVLVLLILAWGGTVLRISQGRPPSPSVSTN